MRTILLLLTLVAASNASTIVYTGAPTGANDGAYYVLPYQVTIDGVSQLVTCYDTHDDVTPGDTWTANLLTITQAAATGYFSGAGALSSYERVAWLSAQTYSDNDQQVGLQHAIWNVFGSASVTPATTAYDQAADAAAAGGYAGFDFSTFRFIEEVGVTPGQPGTEQAFVYNSTASAPEPGTLGMMAGGLVLAGIGAKLNANRKTKQAVS